jgi:two-component system, OmpR family, alkaline phosphatase synthesis response regulator PhoP
MSNTPTYKILLVDDEPDIIELLQYNLEKEGYEVKSAPDGRKAIELAQTFLPNLVLLDIMMPQLDGIETGRLLRQMPALQDTVILFLTARTEEYSEVVAFDIGADDYITKPIKPRALMSRIQALLRRKGGGLTEDSKSKDKIEIGELVINRQNHNVFLNGEPLVFPRKEFELLAFLAEHPDKVFSREELLQRIWGADIYVLERTIDVHIRKLREKIGENYIKTLKGVGYMFTVE